MGSIYQGEASASYMYQHRVCSGVADRMLRLKEHGDDFQGPGVRLGQLFVSSDCIRLHEIYSTTGHTWQAEVSYMLPT